MTIHTAEYDRGLNWPDRYYPADRVPYDPIDEEIKNMLWIIAYDICDGRRLHKVAKTCELYGVRIEKSVFEADLAHERLTQFWCELMDLIEEDEDAVIAYPIPKSAVKEILSMGVIKRPAKRLCYVCGCA